MGSSSDYFGDGLTICFFRLIVIGGCVRNSRSRFFLYLFLCLHRSRSRSRNSCLLCFFASLYICDDVVDEFLILFVCDHASNHSCQRKDCAYRKHNGNGSDQNVGCQHSQPHGIEDSALKQKQRNQHGKRYDTRDGC